MRQERATRFLNENTPLINNPYAFFSINCPSKTLLGRFFLRNGVALLLGITAGVATNWLEEKHNVSEHLGDVISCLTTLVTSYAMDGILEKCWPTNPYLPRNSIFSGFNANNINSNLSLEQTTCATP